MIIDYENKYLFVGLPFSGSSAISKELVENYGAQTAFHKHCNVPFLIKKRSDINIASYKIFAVVRDPLDILYSIYSKIVANAHEMYSRQDFFIENGGDVSVEQRKMYQKVRGMSFERFLLYKYRFIPYDNVLSLNQSHITHFLRFGSLSEDFDLMLKTIGLKQKRQLPHYNQTLKKQIDLEGLREQRAVQNIFAPFYFYNSRFFLEQKYLKADFLKSFTYKMLRSARDARWLKMDERRSKRTKTADYWD